MTIAQDRYMVFFTDKDNTPYSVSEPLEILSQRALDRRTLLEVEVIKQDLPVDPAYVAGLKNAGADVFFTSRWMNAALVTMESTLETTIEGLSYVQEIEFVAPGKVLSRVKSEFTMASSYDAIVQTETSDIQNEMLEIDVLHAKNATGNGVLIGVFDGGFTGVNQAPVFRHLHENNKIKGFLDFVGNTGNPFQYSNHGTGVLSCISGRYGASYTGTAPNADVILAVTEEGPTEYKVEEYNWLFAAEYADSAGVDIINTSLGYFEFIQGSQMHYPEMDYTYEDLDGETAVITKAANLAAARGILIVTSMGNEGTSDFQACLDSDNWCYASAPADSPNVLAVGAVTSNESQKASFSSFGPTSDDRIKPDISAMGSLTTVSNSSGQLYLNSGTSFSSPLIAGVAACIKQAYPDLTNVEIMQLLKDSGTRSSNANNLIGHGVPKSSQILILEGDFTLQSLELDFNFKVYPNPFMRSFMIENLSRKALSYQVFDMNGRQIFEEISNDPYIEIELNGERGLYFVHLTSGSMKETIKLLKN